MRAWPSCWCRPSPAWPCSGLATASAAQGGGIGQVHQHVAALEQMTQQNATLVEQSASAAGGLRDQATQLNAAVQRFKLQAVGQMA